MVRTHCLTEDIALVRLEDLLVPQSQQLAISLRLHVLRVDTLMMRIGSLILLLVRRCFKRLHVIVGPDSDQLDGVHRGRCLSLRRRLARGDLRELVDGG